MKVTKTARFTEKETEENAPCNSQAVDVILTGKKCASSYEMPANAIVVETFAETCDVLGLMSCGDGKDLLDELMKNRSRWKATRNSRAVCRVFFTSSKSAIPNAEPEASRTPMPRLTVCKRGYSAMYEREDLQCMTE